MFKELKYVLYILTIFLFIFFITKHYLSGSNKKNYFLNMDKVDDLLNDKIIKLNILDNDTENIIEYTDLTNNEKTKTFYFWELLKSDKN